MNPRLAIVLSHPTQYYSPWFRWIAKHTPTDLRVYYLWDFGAAPTRDPQFGRDVAWDVPLLNGYPHEFVANVARDPGTHHFYGLRNPLITHRLQIWHPGAILLFGYNYVSHLRIIFWARTHRVPLIFRGDSHFLGRPTLGWLKIPLLRLLYRQFAAVTYVGQANRDYFLRLGVPESHLHFAPHAVDDSLYDDARSDHISACDQLRRRLGLLPGTLVILFAGKLVGAKQPRALLAAYRLIQPKQTALIFVGDGEEKQALIAAAAGANDVFFLPFANQSEMPARYLLADLLALPSSGVYETWGLAVNEAMHMGAPCLVSDLVGCQRDLVTEGETGWVFNAASPQALSDALNRAVTALRSDREGFRYRVKARVQNYTYRASTEGLLRALAQVVPTA